MGRIIPPSASGSGTSTAPAFTVAQAVEGDSMAVITAKGLTEHATDTESLFSEDAAESIVDRVMLAETSDGSDYGEIDFHAEVSADGSAYQAKVEVFGTDDGNVRMEVTNTAAQIRIDAQTGQTDPLLELVGAFTVNPDGSVIAAALPTADPEVAGALWNDAGTLKISAG